jgi:hypothetical protein
MTGSKRPVKIADVRARETQRKRDVVLELMREGASVKDACVKAGWSINANGQSSAYNWNRKRHPQWAAELDYARTLMRELGPTSSERARETPVEFSEFVSKWFPDRRPHLPHQLEIASTLAELKPRDIVMVLLWPEAGKTATLEDYITRKIALDPSHRFRYVSEAADLSKRVIGTVQRRFTDEATYGNFIARYGPFYEKNQERNGRPWTTEQITVIQNTSGERDRNLVASSWTSAVYGSRIDTLVLDDLQSQRNYVQAEDIFRRIRGTFFNRGIEMRTLIIGTRIGPGDFYERMRDAGLVTREVILAAEDPVTGEPTRPEFWDKDIFHDGGSCCSGFRTCPRDHSRLTPREFMELIRHQSGAEVWASSYQQNPGANERTTFTEFLNGCLDRDRVYGPLKGAA